MRATASFDPISADEENRNLVTIEASDKINTAVPNRRQQFDDESIQIQESARATVKSSRARLDGPDSVGQHL